MVVRLPQLPIPVPRRSFKDFGLHHLSCPSATASTDIAVRSDLCHIRQAPRGTQHLAFKTYPLLGCTRMKKAKINPKMAETRKRSNLACEPPVPETYIR